jgi:hypothetical protein
MILLLGITLWAGAISGAEQWLEFSRGKVGETPKGFLSLVAGEGPPGEWKIVLDDMPTMMESITGQAPVSKQHPVLAQVSRDRTDERFPLLIYDEEPFTDFKLTTKFRIVDGVAEQIAGVVFRFQNVSNFYYVRASAQSGTIYFFKVVDGERSPPIGSRTNVAAGVWHELAVECKGTQIRVRFNGNEAMPMLEDRSFAKGKVGFWTKSDAVTYFGDTQLSFTSREILAQLLVRDAFRKYNRLRGLKIYAVQTNETQARIIASLDAKEVGQAAPKEEQDVLTRGTIYYGKGPSEVVVTMPLRDVNGDVAAAVRVVMNTFSGQTERNAIVRALPVVKMMEPRVQRTADLFQ